MNKLSTPGIGLGFLLLLLAIASAFLVLKLHSNQKTEPNQTTIESTKQ